MSHNKLEGPIPNSFRKYDLLTILDLSGNSLSGPLPESLANCRKLTVLKLYKNYELSGNIDDMSNNNENNLCSRSSNNALPAVVASNLIEYSPHGYHGHHSTHRFLHRYHSSQRHYHQHDYQHNPNNHYKVIPNSIFKNLVNLVDVNLSFNQLTGSLHSFLPCIKLQKLILNNNQLVGCIPPEISNLVSLEVLYIHYNNIT